MDTKKCRCNLIAAPIESDERLDLYIDWMPCAKTGFLTHGGNFDYSNIFGMVIGAEFGPVHVYLTDNLDVIENASHNELLCDVGGLYDPRTYHYDNSLSKEKRKNGVIYSSAALMWKDFGGDIIDQQTGGMLTGSMIDNRVDLVDELLFEKLDAYRNQDSGAPIDPDERTASIISMIWTYNPTAEQRAHDSFGEYASRILSACRSAKHILDSTIQQAVLK